MSRWISALAPTSTPWVGSSRISTDGPRGQPPGQRDLLLVAAGEMGDRRVEGGRLDREAVDEGAAPPRARASQSRNGPERMARSTASVALAATLISGITPWRRRSSGT